MVRRRSLGQATTCGQFSALPSTAAGTGSAAVWVGLEGRVSGNRSLEKPVDSLPDSVEPPPQLASIAAPASNPQSPAARSHA